MSIFAGGTNIREIYADTDAIKSVYAGSEKIWGRESAPYLCFTSIMPSGSTIKLSAIGSSPSGTWGDYIHVQTSNDAKTWEDYTLGTTISLANGEKVYFKAKDTNPEFCTNDNNRVGFAMTGKIEASGNMNTLLNADVNAAETMELPARAFAIMFYKCSALVTPPRLPATVISNDSYAQLFRDCVSLTAMPDLPALVVPGGGYIRMFNGCSSLQTWGNVAATTVQSQGMDRAFEGCDLRSVSVNVVSMSGTYPLWHAFLNNRNLSEVRVKFTSWSTATNDWLNGVASTGDFYGPTTLINKTTSRNVNTVPSGWTLIPTD